MSGRKRLISKVPLGAGTNFTFPAISVSNLPPLKFDSLVPGNAAIAMYYNEGSIKPKGYGAVAHYLTRTSETFVNENGKWVMVTGHYSPITGGQGTSQVGGGVSEDE